MAVSSPVFLPAMQRISRSLRKVIKETDTLYWLLKPVATKAWPRSAEIQRDRQGHIAISDVSQNDVVNLVLPNSEFLTKRVRFPKKIRNDLSKAVDLYVRQSFPNGGEQLTYCFVVAGKANENLEIDIHLVRKKSLEEIKSACDALGLQMRTVAVPTSSGMRNVADNRKKTDKAYKIWMSIAYACMLSSILVLIGVSAAGNAKIKMTTHSALEETQKLSQTISDKIQEAQEEEAALGSTLTAYDALSYDASVTKYLTSLANSLPETVILQSFAYGRQELGITGLSKLEITELAKLISELDWVASAELAGPTRFDRATESERFQISVKIAMPTEKP